MKTNIIMCDRQWLHKTGYDVDVTVGVDFIVFRPNTVKTISIFNLALTYISDTMQIFENG